MCEIPKIVLTMKCDHTTQLHSSTYVENTEKVTFAIYVMTHGLRVSFFIVELTLVITYLMYMCESTAQSINCIPLDG
jgi:hypothetical protein